MKCHLNLIFISIFFIFRHILSNFPSKNVLCTFSKNPQQNILVFISLKSVQNTHFEMPNHPPELFFKTYFTFRSSVLFFPTLNAKSNLALLPGNNWVLLTKCACWFVWMYAYTFNYKICSPGRNTLVILASGTNKINVTSNRITKTLNVSSFIS